jgi:hypothetical protein
MKHGRIIHTNIDAELLHAQVLEFLDKHALHSLPQVSLTSISGNDDWLCANGKIHQLEYPERFYGTVNQSIQGTYIHQLIEQYPAFYRWRLLKLSGRTTYSIHPDGNGNQDNYRLHIPVVTNPQCWMTFYDSMPQHSVNQQITHYHLKPGNTYEMDTTNLHTAVNYGVTDRYHIVGVRYESSNNRSQ